MSVLGARTMAGDVARTLAERVAAGELQADPVQAELAERLDRLNAALAVKPGFFRKRPEVRGLYVWGGAGRGKTLLMDLFFSLSPEPKKKRSHFHAFMTEMHERLRDFRDEKGRQPIEALAQAVAADARLLCLDELQVKDIADAMILNRLFAGLIAAGTVIVTTSNSPPEELYYKGLNRDRFLPFIALVKERMDVMRFDTVTDYRFRKLTSAPVWYAPPDEAAMDAAFAALAGKPSGEPQTLRVQGRDVPVPQALNGVARFTFDELCDKPHGPADFAAIARTYHTLVVDNIPDLETTAQDAVRRFIILIDELYDNGTKLIASAQKHPEKLLTQGRQEWDFRRTSSRLVEMGSKEWLLRAHTPEVHLNSAAEQR